MREGRVQGWETGRSVVVASRYSGPSCPCPRPRAIGASSLAALVGSATAALSPIPCATCGTYIKVVKVGVDGGEVRRVGPVHLAPVHAR